MEVGRNGGRGQELGANAPLGVPLDERDIVVDAIAGVSLGVDVG